MKLLFTSAGIINQPLADALRELVGKPTADQNVLFIPTAANPERDDKGWVVKDMNNIFDLGWKNFEIVDLAAVYSLPYELWWPKFDRADVIVVGGGNTFYLSYWLEKSGLALALPHMLESKVYLGIGAGGMLLGPSIQFSQQALDTTGILRDDEYDEIGPEEQSSTKTLQLVDFIMRPHYNTELFPQINDVYLQEVAANVKVPLYAIDDQTAIKVIDDKIEVVSEGVWKLYNKAM